MTRFVQLRIERRARHVVAGIMSAVPAPGMERFARHAPVRMSSVLALSMERFGVAAGMMPSAPVHGMMPSAPAAGMMPPVPVMERFGVAAGMMPPAPVPGMMPPAPVMERFGVAAGMMPGSTGV